MSVYFEDVDMSSGAGQEDVQDAQRIMQFLIKRLNRPGYGMLDQKALAAQALSDLETMQRPADPFKGENSLNKVGSSKELRESRLTTL